MKCIPRCDFLVICVASTITFNLSNGFKFFYRFNTLCLDPLLLKRLVGSLMYLTATRPDIMYGIILISRFMESPKESHWKEGKRIMRHVSGKKDLCIMYSTSENFKLIRYIDSDNGGSTNDKKNTYQYTFHFGIGVVLWTSKKQTIVTLSSTEVEYVVTTSTTC